MRALHGWLRPFHLLTNLMNAVGTIGILVIMILIVFDVTMRTAVGRPLVGVPEIVKLGIVSIVFLQAAHTLSVGRFTSSGIFLSFVARRSPRAARVIEALFHLAGAVLFAFVARGAFDQFSHNFETKEFIGSQGIFTVPVWPMHAVILFGSAILSLQFCVCALQLLAGHEESLDAKEILQ